MGQYTPLPFWFVWIFSSPFGFFVKDNVAPSAKDSHFFLLKYVNIYVVTHVQGHWHIGSSVRLLYAKTCDRSPCPYCFVSPSFCLFFLPFLSFPLLVPLLFLDILSLYFLCFYFHLFLCSFSSFLKFQNIFSSLSL